MTTDPDRVRREAELERTTALRGFRFGIHEFWAAVDLDHLVAVNDEAEASYLKERLLDPKTKQLLYIAGCVGMGDTVPHLQLHVHAAQKVGASPEEILEVFALLEALLGTLRIMPGLDAWRATFRPEVPPIQRVAELR